MARRTKGRGRWPLGGWRRSSGLERLELRRLLALVDVSIADRAVAEGDAASNMLFTLERAGATDVEVRVPFQTVEIAGGATPLVDFTPVAGTATFVAGAGTATVTVPILGDGSDENDESFELRLLSAQAVHPAPSLAAPTVVAAGSQLFEHTLSDVNLDGRLDIITANGVNNNVSVLRNTTPPGATPPSFVRSDFPAGNGPTFVVAGDLNGDGRPDLVVSDFGSNFSPATTAAVLLNTSTPGGAASFAAAVTFTVGTNPRSVGLADFNGDGRLDIAVANLNSDNMSVLINTMAAGAATPTFAPRVNFATGAANSNARAIAVGDLSGDGRADVAVADAISSTLAVLVNTTPLGAAAPTFAARQEFSTPAKPISVAIADLNGDGRADLATANGDGNNASVFLNLTAPGAAALTLAARADFAAGNDPFDVAVGDLNRDGQPDLLVANRANNSMSVLRSTTRAGAAPATFAAKVDFATGSQPRSVNVGDLNGDGRPDVTVGNWAGSNVSVFVNNLPPLADAAPVLTAGSFPSGDEPVALAAGDLDRDSRPDLVTANRTGQGVSWLRNATTPGALQAAADVPVNVALAGEIVDLAVADFDNDGAVDVVVADATNSRATVLRNSTPPSGALTLTPQDNNVAQAPRRVAAGDLNGDGRADVVSLGDSIASVLLNDTAAGAGATAFLPAQDVVVPAGAGALALADLNRDGRLDLVVGGGAVGAGFVWVLLATTPVGGTTISFAAPTELSTLDPVLRTLVADLNGDGFADLVAQHADRFVVWLNTTAPGAAAASFAAPVEFPATAPLRSLVAADFSHDGRVDLASSRGPDAASGAIDFWINTTAAGAAVAAFAPAAAAFTGDAAELAVVDVNLDGLVDLAAAHPDADQATLLVNTPIAITDDLALGTLLDDDPPPQASFVLAEQTAAENSGAALIEVRLSQASGLDVSLPFSVEPLGTADDPADYTIPSAAPLLIPAGQLSALIQVELVDDGDVEGDETLILRLGEPTHATLGATASHTLTIASDDAPASVIATHVFYNNSAFDGNDPAAGAADDGAIASDKSALLPGGVASLVNYTSYSKGINGLMIDVAGAAAGIGADDFQFRVGNNNAVAAWPPLAAEPAVSVRPGAGSGGSDRVTLIWPDGTIRRQWLQLTMLATAETRLPEPQVFYIGNAVGESGNSTTDAVVNATDEIGARTHPVGPFPTAAVDNLYDFNRDRLVNATDQIVARTSGTNPLTALRLISVPAGAAPAAAAAVPLPATEFGAASRSPAGDVFARRRRR